MIQLELLDIKPPIKKRPGRPSSITGKKLYDIINDIKANDKKKKKKLTNEEFFQLHGISSRSFYRIKKLKVRLDNKEKGVLKVDSDKSVDIYEKILDKYLDEMSDNFSLKLTD